MLACNYIVLTAVVAALFNIRAYKERVKKIKEEGKKKKKKEDQSGDHRRGNFIFF